jgi:rRNA processing protein Krr1/Pno1
MAIQGKSVFAPAPFCVSRFHKETESVEIVCIGPEMKVYTIDGVCGFIWRQLDGKTALKTVIDKITGEFEVTATKAKRDLEGFIEQLLLLELIQER